MELPASSVFNDEILCALARPQLSSIVPDPQGTGYMAAQMLHEPLLEGRTSTMERWVRPLTVCSRQTTDASVVFRRKLGVSPRAYRTRHS